MERKLLVICAGMVILKKESVGPNRSLQLGLLESSGKQGAPPASGMVHACLQGCSRGIAAPTCRASASPGCPPKRSKPSIMIQSFGGLQHEPGRCLVNAAWCAMRVAQRCKGTQHSSRKPCMRSGRTRH